MRRCSSALGLAALLLTALASGSASAGSFMFSSEGSEDIITHPTGYTSSGGNLPVSICIDPTSASATDMIISVENVARTMNTLAPTVANLISGIDNNIPAGEIDFESLALHEVGHCLGLRHPNLASNSNYTRSTDGVNGVFDTDPGVDAVIGSSDDVRIPDDVNLHWFRISNDNPFTIDSPVDSSTYSRDVAVLPAGHLFPANADRGVGSLLGVSDTEAVMQAGAFTDEAQRTLNHDDVAMLRYAMSGFDEVEGTSDDYTFELSYVGLTTSCDIVLTLDDAEPSAARCSVSGSVNGDHVVITAANITFNGTLSWFFNDESNAPVQIPTVSVWGLGAITFLLLGASVRTLRRGNPRDGRGSR